MTTFVNIGTLARQLSVTHRTLRFWEDRGLIKSFRPKPNATRTYNEVQATRAHSVAQLTRFGFTLFEVGQLLDAPSCTLQRRYAQQQNELELERARINDVIEELRAARFGLDALTGKPTDE